MADKEISSLTAATTPLAGTELVHIDQGGDSRKALLSDVVALSTGAMLASTYDPDTNGIIAVAQGGTNAATASGARTNLGLGTMAVQNAATVAITGGSITGITDLTVADGGTGASDASGARTNLGLAIGTDVQAYSANLAGFAATTVANVQNRDNHTGTQLAATISDFSTAADLRIAAAVGVSVQAYDPLLASVSGLSLTAGDIIYATGSDAVASLPVGAAGQVLAVNGSGEPAWDTSLVVGGLIAANNLSDVANSDTSLTNLGFGAAGKAIAADATTEDVRSYLNLAKPSATRTAMKALDWTQYDRFELFESGREGVFLKNTSDLSSILVGSAVNSSAVNAGTDTITSTAHGLGTGNAVITTTAVNGLALNTIYYVILVDANNFQLATSYANAVAGTEIDLTGTTAVTVKLHFDPNETLYVTPTTDITGASGAAVRQHEGVLMSSWAGVPDDSTSDCSPSIAALIALCNRNAIWGTIQFGNAGYRLGTRLPDITRNVVIRGTRAAFQRSILIKDYVETSDNKGVLTFVNGGWVIEDLTIAGLSGASGGCGIAQVTTGTTAATANLASHFMNRVHIALGDRVKKTMFINGGTNVEVAGPGLRVVMMNSCEFFGAAEWTLDFQSVQHVFISNSFVSTSGGTASGGALRIGGTASAPSDDYSIDTTLIAGLIDLDRLSRSKFDGLRVQGNINNTSNCTHIRILGTYNSGTLQHNWDNDNCEYSLGVQYKDVAHVSRASSQQADITGDGTKAVILWDTVASMASLLNWDSTLVYNTANGRFTALKTGVHSIRANPMLVGLTSSHTQCDVFVETFTSGGSAVLVRQNRFNPWAIATGTRASIPIAEDVMMGVGQYMTISVTVTGGTKVVDVDHVSGFSRAQFKLAS